MLQYIYLKSGGITMKKLIVDIDESLLKNTEEVLDEMGLDIGTAIKVMFKRIVREGNPSFLFNNKSVKTPIDNNGQQEEIMPEVKTDEPIKMTKNKAIALFRNKGITFNGNVTFASKNKTAYNYWANPSFEVLDNDWFLILNDWMRREIYLFKIPAKTYRYNQLVSRADKSQIDLQIMYEDNSFTDTRSKISFAKYLKDKISY